MHFSQTILLGLAAAFSSVVAIERLNRTDVALLIVDHQVGLFQLVRDIGPAEYRNNVLAHSALGNLFNLPTVLSTGLETGPNGPLIQEIIDMHPKAPFVKRSGEINAFDNADFRKAVAATGKKQVIVAGITTDGCTAFVALSLADAGYTVYANSDASGAFDLRSARDANDRMRAAGVNVLSNFAIFGDLLRDWRSPDATAAYAYVDKYLPTYGFLARGYTAVAAGSNSTTA